MIILIAGASHVGKTALAQRLMKKYNYPYLSIDLLKMGLIRSGNTHLTPEDDDELTEYLWPIVSEIIKTAIENSQNLIVEGCYIPFDWEKAFGDRYRSHIRYYCLVMTESYINQHFDDIVKYGSVIEQRLDDSDLTKEFVLRENAYQLEMCRKYGHDPVLIDGSYHVEIDIEQEKGEL